ncbi:hypothetical protein ColLi_07246 [Colletotrichum liriopes]|uniref:Uncharacterized protein n=1 Tax=Colletotrichum liriopes TaxID=708192 RepID=A0AA37GNQ1_9PEZI|nr:hypothetical protein ColLi_07246 [Colletotrichum liriopes]
MAVTAEERFNRMQAARMAASTAAAAAASNAPSATKRRATSSTITAPAKRRKSSNNSMNIRSTSSPPRRCKSSSPIIPALPVQRTPGAPYTGVPARTRTYHDFPHFLRAMSPDARQSALKSIKDTRLDGEERWRDQRYNPIYATEACKIAFLIQAELKDPDDSRQDGLEGERKRARLRSLRCESTHAIAVTLYSPKQHSKTSRPLLSCPPADVSTCTTGPEIFQKYGSREDAFSADTA